MSLPALLDHVKKTTALSQVAGLISWDQETMMPVNGAAQRAEQAGTLASVIHAREADPRVADWIADIDGGSLSAFDKRNVAEAQRAYDRATKIPSRLAEESAKAASEGQRIWAKARAEKDFSVFAPGLKRNIELAREKAHCLTESGGELYDSLLDEFEPNATSAELVPLLEGMRAGLVALREKIEGKAAPEMISGHFPADAQIALAKTIAARLGYDFDAGRIDTVVHPFCSGNGGDVRITTRTDEADPFNCLYSTIHEVGHALYSQGALDPYMPAADYCSMGVHESQSRFWENQIGRSRPFADWLYPAMEGAFGTLSLSSPDALYAAVNRVHSGFIRTEADEVHYNLHILLRVRKERDLISGALQVDDLEAAWNTRFEEDFGETVPDPSLGVLQDVHWSVGLFGYFPTYSLGNIYSACLDSAMRADLPDWDAMVRAAETQPILDWLRERIHAKGRLLPAPELIAQATGEAPSAKPLIAYLEDKFSALYDL
ncbi:MAG: carboxypeptidase M32 [Pseudomonadota bacterium]